MKKHHTIPSLKGHFTQYLTSTPQEWQGHQKWGKSEKLSQYKKNVKSCEYWKQHGVLQDPEIEKK